MDEHVRWPELTENGNVRSKCPDCDGALTTFEAGGRKSGSFGSVARGTVSIMRTPQSGSRAEWEYKLLRCAGCGRGGFAAIHNHGTTSGFSAQLVEFFPPSPDLAAVPAGISEKVLNDYREAEWCAAFGAFRAGSALLRSTLEKLLRANGYEKGNLKDRIDQAADEGIITEALKQRAHDNVRDLGNDIMHDDWRAVDPEEFASAHRYVQRVIESFYNSRTQVETLLTKANRVFEKVIYQ